MAMCKCLGIEKTNLHIKCLLLIYFLLRDELETNLDVEGLGSFTFTKFMSMSGKKAKLGDFMKQKWPCILTCNLDTNQVKNVIFVRKSS